MRKSQRDARLISVALTRAELESMIANIGKGMSLRQAIPDYIDFFSFYEQVHADPQLAMRYSRAQQAKAERLADEINDIADTEVDCQRARNRIDARKWYASKMQPNKYGDRIDLNVTQALDINAALTEATKRVMLPRRDPTNIEDAQIIETQQITHKSCTDCKSEKDAKASDDASAVNEVDIFS